MAIKILDVVKSAEEPQSVQQTVLRVLKQKDQYQITIAVFIWKGSSRKWEKQAGPNN